MSDHHTEDSIHPFRIDIPQAALDDLHRRLEATRWPERETAEGAAQGVPLARMQALAEHWRHRYDWRRTEARLNAFAQYRTNIDGLGIHFLHIRSRHADALPMLLTHGWPGSVLEFEQAIAPLVDPTAHGGRASDAFHLVIPSIPGFGFSDKPSSTGWTRQRIAQAWGTLMGRLGYTRYVAQGGDWGSAITHAMANEALPGLAAIHINLPTVLPAAVPAQPTAQEQAAYAALQKFSTQDFGYYLQQMTRPQTIGYALADSPVGLAAWMAEKFIGWADNSAAAGGGLAVDTLLDHISLYWLTNTATSSARLYWENPDSGFAANEIHLPVGVSVFPHDFYQPPKAWAERCYHHLIHWNEVAHGGHFAALEQPAIFVDELRTCFASLRA